MSEVKIGLSQYGQLYEGNAAPKAIQAALDKTKVYGISLIQASTPVKTGKAKAGWRVIQEGKGLTWTNQVPYTVYLEFGTVNMRARPMLEPNLPYIRDFFKKEVVKSIGRKAASGIVSKKDTPVSYASATSGFTGKKKRR